MKSAWSCRAGLCRLTTGEALNFCLTFCSRLLLLFHLQIQSSVITVQPLLSRLALQSVLGVSIKPKAWKKIFRTITCIDFNLGKSLLSLFEQCSEQGSLGSYAISAFSLLNVLQMIFIPQFSFGRTYWSFIAYFLHRFGLVVEYLSVPFSSTMCFLQVLSSGTYRIWNSSLSSTLLTELVSSIFMLLVTAWCILASFNDIRC